MIEMKRIAGLIMALGALVLAGCGNSEPTDFVPAGVAQDRPTFLFLFTEN